MFPWLHSLLGRGSHVGMSQQPRPLPFFPPLLPAMLCNEWMQKYPSLDHQCSPVHPSPGLCVLSLHSSKVPLCLTVPHLSSCFLSTSKLQKYLIKGGFTFKPVQQVKLHAGEQLTPTTCYSLSVCSDHCDCTCTASQLLCPLDFLARASRENKKEKLKININLPSVSVIYK